MCGATMMDTGFAIIYYINEKNLNYQLRQMLDVVTKGEKMCYKYYELN